MFSIEDYTKAFWMLNGERNSFNLCVEKVTEDGAIYLSNGTMRLISTLAKDYDRMYRSSAEN